ncbi:helix-turn-helix domain-containing protein [Actinocrispum wychmicini]|uniref:WD40 repeat protein n=1 Tax=Actinocrispum wychmicini TaxID=1213861 RepID=A0A4R2JC95_9PSEU|nr:helix-turn-helix domain-containing protein [Actinocrispum wychmicini]TCO53729.1 WD40 repeat protein [Actinocrispum wychmicini]
MSRRERPLDDGVGALSQFAEGLRQLRRDAGSPTYRELGTRARYSAGTLSDAAGGRKLPTLAVTLAYVRACGGDAEVWEQSWYEVNTEIEASAPQTTDNGDPPYVGLAPFQPADAERFFGRDTLVDELLVRLKTNRFVTVFGPSGVGKSSLLRAGLIPRLDVPYVLFTPGEHPMAAYLDSVDHVGAADDLVIVVDQFEEVFTVCTDTAERAEFIDSLLGADHRVVVGMRADFYSHCASHPGLAKALCEAQLLVGPMGAGELRVAITQPAVQAGYVVEGALVAELVAESAGQAGLLPMVSHVLRETWHRRRGNTLTRTGYQAAGGIQGALAKTAEDVYASFDGPQQAAARQLFLRLTALGEGTEDTKRRIGRGEFDGTELNDVLTALASARLITVDAGSVEMAHESLIKAWPRLRGWLSEDREGLRIHRQLTEAALAWESLGRDPGALYRGTRLQLAQDWPGSASLVGREREFLDTSFAAFVAERETARRGARRLRVLTIVLAVLLVIAVVATFLAFRAQSISLEQRNVAISQKLASQSDALRAVNPALAAQLSLAAYRLSPTTEARGSLLSAFGSPYATQLTGHTDSVNVGAWSPDGHTAATASDDHSVFLWDMADPHRPTRLSVIAASAMQVYDVSFRSDGNVLVIAGEDGAVGLWDVSDRVRPRLLSSTPAHPGSVYSATFGQDGRMMATAGEDDLGRIWDVSDPAHPRELATLRGHTARIHQIAFRPGSSVVATASSDHTVRLWDISDLAHPKALRVLTDHTDNVRSVMFDPAGKVMVTTSLDRTVRLWDVSDPANTRQLALLGSATDNMYSAAFSPDGHTVAAVGDDRVVHLWNVTDPVRPYQVTTLVGHTEKIFTAAFSPSGRDLLTASWDRTARVWDLADLTDPAAPGFLAGHSEAVYAVAFSPDRRTAATGGNDNTVRLWDVTDPEHPRSLAVLAGHTGPVRSMAFSPSGGMLASGSSDSTIRLWDLADRDRPRPLPSLAGHTQDVYSVAFSPSGRQLASASNDNSAILWDISDPAAPRYRKIIDRPQIPLYAVAFSPSGLLATAGFDADVMVWDPAAPDQPVTTLHGHTGHVNGLAFGPSGMVLASVGADATLRLWDLTDQKRPVALGTATDRAGPLATVAFSPDGHTVATTSDVARLWDVGDPTRPTELATLTGHGGRVSSVAFGPDGHTMATAGDDHLVIVRDTDVERVATRVCATAFPRLTRADWDQYLPGIGYAPPCP